MCYLCYNPTSPLGVGGLGSQSFPQPLLGGVYPSPYPLPGVPDQGSREVESYLYAIVYSFLRFLFFALFFDAFWILIFRGFQANMDPKSVDFQGPGAPNLSMFAQLTSIYAKSAKIAPLPYENLIFTYFRHSKIIKNR